MALEKLTRTCIGARLDRKSTRLNSSHARRSHLPSFPTRRSADLIPRFLRPETWPEQARPFLIHGTRKADSNMHRGPPRSEEHTSELQSRPPLTSPLFPYTALCRSYPAFSETRDMARTGAAILNPWNSKG